VIDLVVVDVQSISYCCYRSIPLLSVELSAVVRPISCCCRRSIYLLLLLLLLLLSIDLSAVDRSISCWQQQQKYSPLSMRSTNSLTVDMPSIDLSAAVVCCVDLTIIIMTCTS
jgi:hypothetical protein